MSGKQGSVWVSWSALNKQKLKETEGVTSPQTDVYRGSERERVWVSDRTLILWAAEHRAQVPAENTDDQDAKWIARSHTHSRGRRTAVSFFVHK